MLLGSVVLTLVVAIGLQAAAAARPELTERLYARGVFPPLARGLSALSGALPFSLAELLLVLALAGAVTLLVRRAFAPLALGLAVLYLLFVLLWALNYSRPPLSELCGLPVHPAPAAELAALAAELAQEADAARRGLPEDEAGAMRLPDGLRGAARRAGEGFAAAARLRPDWPGLGLRLGPPRAVLLSPLLSRLGISGIYSPYTGEANLDGGLPDVDVPFCMAHEMAHQRGFAREDEASYVATVACRAHPDGDFRYSGLLAASLSVMSALYGADPVAWERLERARSLPVQRDIAALAAFQRRYRGPASQVARAVNDAYLRTQGQQDGVASYGRVVDLLLAERRVAAQPERSPQSN